MQSRKIGVTVNLFDGGENLLPVLQTLYKSGKIGHVNIVYSTFDNRKKTENLAVEGLCKELYSNGTVDSIYKYDPDPSIHAVKNELIKRNIGMDILRSHGHRVAMCIDADELYLPHLFQDWLIDALAERKLLQSFLFIRSYYGNINAYYHEQLSFLVPFLVSLDSGCYSMSNTIEMEVLAGKPLLDATRRYHKVSENNSIVIPNFMHHLTYVRESLRPKLSHSSAVCSSKPDEIEEVCKYFSDWKESSKGLIFRHGSTLTEVELKETTLLSNFFRREHIQMPKHFTRGVKTS